VVFALVSEMCTQTLPWPPSIALPNFQGGLTW